MHAMSHDRSNDPSQEELTRTVDLFSENRYAELASLAQELTRRFPKHPFGWKALGLALKKTGSPDALAVMRKAIELAPRDADALTNLGNLLQEQGHFEEAGDYLQRALAIEPDSIAALNNLGLTLQKQARLDESEVFLRKALHIKPDYAEALFNLGVTLQICHRQAEAQDCFKQALRNNPNDINALNNLGQVLQDVGETKEAEMLFRQALAYKPDFIEAQNSLGSLQRQNGDLEEAEASYRQALRISPDHKSALCNLGMLQQSLWRIDDARSCYKQLLQVNCNRAAGAASLPITVLFPFGRSGSLFFHSLFDGHPDVWTLPGIYLKGWFGRDRWKGLSLGNSNVNWRERLTKRILAEYQPLFDARCKNNVPGKPMDSAWLAKDLGFTDMGEDHSQRLEVNQEKFASVFQSLLAPCESVDAKACFELIHEAFEITVRGDVDTRRAVSRHIFFHIHNPDPFELGGFLQHYPHAQLLHIVRNPVQSLESWMLMDVVQKDASNLHKLNSWNKMIDKMIGMFMDMLSPFNASPVCRGVRLEDVKRQPDRIIPLLASWMGIKDHSSLYEASFCGLQYWGPTSKLTGKIKGFDTRAIDFPVGRLLGLRDIKIFETLFWPLSRMYGYTELDEAGFVTQLAEIRPWLNEPLEFEKKLYAGLSDHSRALQLLPPYRRLHKHLQQYWSILAHDHGACQVVPPLQLD
jgi:tetratricopeptide (TPR) repeat protein